MRKGSSIYWKRAANHARSGMTAELNGMHEVADFHYQQAEFWRSLV